MLMIEEIAKREARVQFMVTFTAPPRFHSNPKIGQCTWDGSSSREALTFLHEVYRTIYKRLHDRNVNILGISAVEPHEDGCPHLHVACFVKSEDTQEFLDVTESVRIEYCDREGVSHEIWNKSSRTREKS